MKSQKGITLASLAIYIVLIFIVIGMLATVTTNIHQNIKEKNADGEKMAEVNKFNMYFIQEVKREGNKIKDITSTNIIFTSGKEFSFDSENKSIKLIDETATIDIAKNIEDCTFNSNFENGRTIITVTIKPQNTEKITKEYILNNEQDIAYYENEEDYIKIAENDKEYTELEYIESTGTQYIDTGYISNSNTTLEYKYKFNDLTSGALGGTGIRNNDNASFFFPLISSQKFRFNIVYSGNGSGMLYMTYDTSYHEAIFNNSNHQVIVDGQVLGVLENYQNYSNTQNLYLFASSKPDGAENYSKSTLKYMKIYDNNTLVRDFIPVLDKNGVACLYDKVKGKYYYNQNQGTEDFEAGPEKKQENGQEQEKTYAQSGLTLWLDGINKGNTQGKWVDQVSGLEFAMNGNYSFQDKYVQFTSGYAESSTIINPVTLEFVIKNEKNGYETLFENNTVSQMVVFNNSQYIQIGGSGKSYPSAQSAILNYTICYDSNKNVAKCYKNGVLQNLAGSTEGWGQSLSGTRIGLYNNGQYPFVGNIYCVRSYNRELTETEILNNYNLDKERFGF